MWLEGGWIEVRSGVQYRGILGLRVREPSLGYDFKVKMTQDGSCSGLRS